MRGLFGFAAGVIGLACATCLFWVGLAFEHRPAGWPNLRVDLWALHWTLRLPDGPWARLERLQGVLDAQRATNARIAAHQAQASKQAGVEAKAAQTVIRWRTRTIIKEIPAHVSPETDRAFALPVGLLRLHDAAALGVPTAEIPAPAGRADGEAGPVAASAFGAAIVENYGTCRADQDRLSRVQAWIDKMTLADAIGLGEESKR